MFTELSSAAIIVMKSDGIGVEGDIHLNKRAEIMNFFVVKTINFAVKTRSFVSRTRNSVFKTRNSVFKMMNFDFAGDWTARLLELHAVRWTSVIVYTCRRLIDLSDVYIHAGD